MAGSDEKPANGLDDLPDATLRTVDDFLSMSARATPNPAALVKALHDSLVLSALHGMGERSRNAKGAGVAASPLN